MQTRLSGWNSRTSGLNGQTPIQKRLFDLSVAATLLIAALPVLLVISIALKWDHRGPIFFKQVRTGHMGRPFNIYKFCTLCGSVSPDDTPLPPTKFRNFLRRWGLDELPQLFNIIRGDMSLVGPRPHTPADNQNFASHFTLYDARHQVQPGITGLAQINGWRGPIRSSSDLKSRLDCDLLYISQQSVASDIVILIYTVSRPWCWVNGPKRTSIETLSSCRAG
ncbi:MULTISPECIES: sugar transferase [Thalassospira]|uniref:sugar transferase n=1 Tax=Thalassospira TaxID=168934 RepID=UPI0009EF2D47|nr:MULTISPECIES: sugar transferase [Thalassospira]MCH2273530.1 sugar transferase [Thalassospira sp.]